MATYYNIDEMKKVLNDISSETDMLLFAKELKENVPQLKKGDKLCMVESFFLSLGEYFVVKNYPEVAHFIQFPFVPSKENGIETWDAKLNYLVNTALRRLASDYPSARYSYGDARTNLYLLMTITKYVISKWELMKLIESASFSGPSDFPYYTSKVYRLREMLSRSQSSISELELIEKLVDNLQGPMTVYKGLLTRLKCQRIEDYISELDTFSQPYQREAMSTKRHNNSSKQKKDDNTSEGTSTKSSTSKSKKESQTKSKDSKHH